MTSQHDLTSQALPDPDLIEEMQFLDHRTRLGPTQTGWVSSARQGQRPTILLAHDRNTLMAESRQLVKRASRQEVRGCWLPGFQNTIINRQPGSMTEVGAFPGP
jgi:hypothetical protein